MKTILIFLVFLFSLGTWAQKMDEADSVARIKAQNLIKIHFAEKVMNKDFVIFSVSNKYFLVIINKKNEFEEYYAQFLEDEDRFVVIRDTFYKKPNKMFDKMFDKSIYYKEFISFKSDFFKPDYEFGRGNSTYFVLIDNECQRYGEARLSFFVKPNPIDTEIYFYLTHQILHYGNL